MIKLPVQPLATEQLHNPSNLTNVTKQVIFGKEWLAGMCESCLLELRTCLQI